MGKKERFVPAHLKEAKEIMFPLFSCCEQLFQEELFLTGPSTPCKAEQSHCCV